MCIAHAHMLISISRLDAPRRPARDHPCRTFFALPRDTAKLSVEKTNLNIFNKGEQRYTRTKYGLHSIYRTIFSAVNAAKTLQCVFDCGCVFIRISASCRKLAEDVAQV